MLRALDCQGFAGGFTLGTVRAGFELVGKVEMQGGFGVPNCVANRNLLGHGWDVQVSDPSDWEPLRADFMFGNPPCSGFSGLSNREFRGIDSPANRCMWAFVEFASRVRPQVAAFESVQQAYTKGEPLMKDLVAKLRANTGERWTLYHVKHSNLALGGCAWRKRYFWVASRIPLTFEQPVLDRTLTLRDAIGDLETLPMDWSPQPYSPDGMTNSPFIQRAWSSTGMVDGHATSERGLAHIARTFELYEDSQPWEEGESLSDWARRAYERTGDLPPAWQETKEKTLRREFQFGFHQPRRWHYDKPARVITGAGPMNSVHPTLPRFFTYREVARVMGFPDDWVIEPLRKEPSLGPSWGKGIPVGSGEWLATQVRESIGGRSTGYCGDAIDEDEFLVDVGRPQIGV